MSLFDKHAKEGVLSQFNSQMDTRPPLDNKFRIQNEYLTTLNQAGLNKPPKKMGGSKS